MKHIKFYTKFILGLIACNIMFIGVKTEFYLYLTQHKSEDLAAGSIIGASLLITYAKIIQLVATYIDNSSLLRK